MVTWPTTLPAPTNTTSVAFGDNSKSRKCQSGRSEIRRYGSGRPDPFNAVFRVRGVLVPDFLLFYAQTSNMGLNWFDAPWIASDLGYTGCYGRIVGYPKRQFYGKIYSDFSVILHIRKISSCWPDTTWPVLAP